MSTRRTLPAGSLLGFAILAMIALSVWSMHFFQAYQPLAGLISGQSGLDQIGLQVHNAVVTGRVVGKRRWKVAAQTITFSRDQRQVTAAGVHNGLLFNSLQQPIASVSAGQVSYQSAVPILGAGSQGMLQINGGVSVKVFGKFGPNITASGLSWNPGPSIAQSVGAVTAVFPDQPESLIGGSKLTAGTVQWSVQSDLLQSPGNVTVAFSGNTGNAIGSNVVVDLHTGNLTMQQLHGTFTLTPQVTKNMKSQFSPPLAFLTGVALLASPLAAASNHPVTYQAGASLWLNSQHQAILSNGVTFHQDDASLFTQSATVNLDNTEHALNAQSSGPVHLWDTQNDLTGNKGYIDFTTHTATVTGNIVLVVKPGKDNTTAPKDSLRNRFKSPATMTCQKMIYNYREKTGEVPGQLTIHQLDGTLTADSGTYNGSLQIVTLTGHVHGTNAHGLINAPQVYVGVREGNEFIRVDHDVTGVFQPGKDNSDNSGPAQADNPQGYNAFKDGGPATSLQPPATPQDTTPTPATPSSSAQSQAPPTTNTPQAPAASP